jgi:hypothetical protein
MKAIRYGAIAALFCVVTSVDLAAAAQSIPPGAQAVAKVRIKPLGKQAALFEITNFECPAGARTARGKAQLLSQWKRELGPSVCNGLRGGLNKEMVRVTYCGGRTVITWTATKKSCGLR